MLISISKKYSLVFFLFALATGSGCAKYRDNDDYKRSKHDEELSKIASLQGTYSGVLVSKTDQTPAGAVKIELIADTEPYTPLQADKAELRPVLRVQVDVQQGELSYPLHFGDAYFDVERHEFKGVKVLGSSKVAIKGTLQDNTLTGTLEVPEHANFGLQFSLKKGVEAATGQQLVTISKARAKIHSSNFERTYSAGVADPLTRDTVSRGLIVSTRSATTEEEFLFHTLVPVSQVQVTYVIDKDNLSILFPSVQLDYAQGKMRGTTFAPSVLGAAMAKKDDLICERHVLEPPAEGGAEAVQSKGLRLLEASDFWHCKIINADRGVIVDADFMPVEQ